MPGNKSDIIPLNNGRSTVVSFAMFMSFIESSRIWKKYPKDNLHMTNKMKAITVVSLMVFTFLKSLNVFPAISVNQYIEKKIKHAVKHPNKKDLHIQGDDAQHSDATLQYWAQSSFMSSSIQYS